MSARDLLGIGLARARGSLGAGYDLVRWRAGRDVRLGRRLPEPGDVARATAT